MIRFVPVSSFDIGEALSGALWALSRPPESRQPQDTQRLFGLATDAAGGVWLEVVTDYAIPVHSEAVLDGLASILLNAGVAQADIDVLAALIASMRGQRLTPWQFFPQVFQDASKLETEITWPSRT